MQRMRIPCRSPHGRYTRSHCLVLKRKSYLLVQIDINLFLLLKPKWPTASSTTHHLLAVFQQYDAINQPLTLHWTEAGGALVLQSMALQHVRIHCLAQGTTECLAASARTVSQKKSLMPPNVIPMVSSSLFTYFHCSKLISIDKLKITIRITTNNNAALGQCECVYFSQQDWISFANTRQSNSTFYNKKAQFSPNKLTKKKTLIFLLIFVEWPSLSLSPVNKKKNSMKFFINFSAWQIFFMPHYKKKFYWITPDTLDQHLVYLVIYYLPN